MVQFESGIKVIPYPQERVYTKLSDLNNLQEFKERLPEDKVKNLICDRDTVSVDISPVGTITLNVVEREPFKVVKFASDNTPAPFNLWIQVVPVTEQECKIKLTVKVEVNPFMKAMIQKPVQEGLDKLADMLAVIPY